MFRKTNFLAIYKESLGKFVFNFQNSYARLFACFYRADKNFFLLINCLVYLRFFHLKHAPAKKLHEKLLKAKLSFVWEN